MRASLALWCVLSAACIDTGTTACPGSDRVCPDGTRCLTLSTAAEPLCVLPEQLAACTGMDDGAACRFGASSDGTCYAGGCLPVGCGNGRIDANETCDDGNNQPGDGCSADCQSNETCGNGLVDPVRSAGGTLVLAEQCDDRDLVGHDGCSSTCSLEAVRYVPVVGIPPARSRAASAYDPRHARIVVFGGYFYGKSMSSEPSVAYDDTWQWSGSDWSRVPTSLQPSARSHHAMAYDAERQRLVLFGGLGTAELGDTWELEGAHWTQVANTTGPTPRHDHAMVFMPRVGTVLFGGRSTVGTADMILGDTWVWRNATWTQLVPPMSPPRRSQHAMAYDPVRDVIVMTGGDTATDTWTFDGTTWTQVAPTIMSPRMARATMLFDPVTRHVLALGGGPPDVVGSRPFETWDWDGSAWTKLTPAVAPDRRLASTTSADPRSGQIVLFGGEHDEPMCTSCDTSTFADTWRWDGATWASVGSLSVPGLAGHAAALDVDRGRVVVYAGGDTWELDGTRWARIATSTRLSYDTQLAYDERRRVTIRFGGQDAPTTFNNTTALWDGLTWTPTTPATSPPARAHHAMAYDAARGITVMFGGGDHGPTMFGDTWEWDGATWIDRAPASAPAHRQDHAMAYDPLRRRVVLFGGFDQVTYYNDLWEWDGTTWTDRTPALSPPGRLGAGLAWDPARARLVLFGGGAPLGNDTWEWDGTAWSVVPLSEPPLRRVQHTVVSSPTGAGVLSIGGSVPGSVFPVSEVLHLDRSATDTSYEVCRTPFDIDGDLLAGCADVDCWTSCTPRCPPGASCDPQAPRCGDGVCNLDLEACGTCADCACIVRCGDLACDASETAVTCPGDCP